MKLRLVRPTLDMEEQYQSFAREWAENGEEITPYAARLLGMPYRDWLDGLAPLEHASTCPAGIVPGTTLFLLGEGPRILGAVNVRHCLNDSLLRVGGHIGYGVRPGERRRGHATAMLALALPVARGLGLDRVLVTCKRANIASARVIVRNGGVLENEVAEEGEVFQRYWIAL